MYKLHAAGVRVPVPYAFVEGVLIMECIEGPTGGPAPRLSECDLGRAHARSVFEKLIREVIRMLCADIVHGDLSPFNVLLEEAGPVVIDFPQAINAAKNRNARKILLRDVANLTSHFMRDRPPKEKRFGHEMWALYERGELRPDTELSGHFQLSQAYVDADALLRHMVEIDEDEAIANDTFELSHLPRPDKAARRGPPMGSAPAGPSRRGKSGKKPGAGGPQVSVKGQLPPPGSAALSPEEPPKKKRRRRRRRRPRGGGPKSS